MTTIKADARHRFSAEDFEFIARTLVSEPGQNAQITGLLTEETSRDAALDAERLLRAILESTEPVSISPHLYFYVLARCCLKNFDRDTADYIASMLATFIDVERLKTLPENGNVNPRYVTDMLTALRAVSSDHAFLIRAQIGNYSLFLTGVFPDHIRHQASRRGAPDISFYEEIGSANYRVASNHPLAQRHSLDTVYRTIADQFTEVRVGLNRLADQLVCIEPQWSPGR